MSSEESLPKSRQYTISLKRFNAIKEIIFDKCSKEDAEFICQKICEIIKLNPDEKTPSNSNRILEWRQKKAQEYGVSVSVIKKGLKNLSKE